MSYSPDRVNAAVYALLGRPDQSVLPYQDVVAARILSGMEVLRAITANPQNGYFGSLETLVSVAHNAFLPAHDGEPGIPQIVPFAGADAIAGKPAKPEEIDSWRAYSAVYSGSYDGVAVAHNAADVNTVQSPTSGRYSIVNKLFKFTGLSAQVPLVQLTRTMADTGIPENYEPTVVRLTAGRLGHAASMQAGLEDLRLISAGSMQVPPLPNVEMAQKQEAT